MTPAEYARYRKCSREAVSKAIRQGRIPVGSNGRIDPKMADAAWDANTPRARGPAEPPALELPNGQPLNLTHAKTLREAWLAEKARLEVGEMSGELVRISDVRDVAFRAARSARDLLHSIPDRLAEVLAGLGPDEIRRLLTGEVHRVSSELSLSELAGPEDEATA